MYHRLRGLPEEATLTSFADAVIVVEKLLEDLELYAAKSWLPLISLDLRDENAEAALIINRKIILENNTVNVRDGISRESQN